MIKIVKYLPTKEIRTWEEVKPNGDNVQTRVIEDKEIIARTFPEMESYKEEDFEIAETDTIPADTKSIDIKNGVAEVKAFTPEELKEVTKNPKVEALKAAKTLDDVKAAVLDLLNL